MRAGFAFIFCVLLGVSAHAGGELFFRFIFTRNIAHAKELVLRGSFREVQSMLPQTRQILLERQPVPYGKLVLPSAYPLTELPGGMFEVVIGYVSFPAVSHSFRQLDTMDWSVGAMQAIARSVKKHT